MKCETASHRSAQKIKITVSRQSGAKRSMDLQRLRFAYYALGNLELEWMGPVFLIVIHLGIDHSRCGRLINKSSLQSLLPAK